MEGPGQEKGSKFGSKLKRISVVFDEQKDIPNSVLFLHPSSNRTSSCPNKISFKKNHGSSIFDQDCGNLWNSDSGILSNLGASSICT